MSIIYEKVSTQLEFLTDFCTNEVAFILGGIIASDESIVRNGVQFWVAPSRYNPQYAKEEEIEKHINYIRKIAATNNLDVLTAELIRNNNLDTGKFSRLKGFGVYVRSKTHTTLTELISAVDSIWPSLSTEVKACFIVGALDGRCSIDHDKARNVIRYIVIDIPSTESGSFLVKTFESFGLELNYNVARDRLEGGRPRQNQLRIRNHEDFFRRVGLINPKKFDVAFDAIKSSHYKAKCKNLDTILSGLKRIEW